MYPGGWAVSARAEGQVGQGLQRAGRADRRAWAGGEGHLQFESKRVIFREELCSERILCPTRQYVLPAC